VKEIKGAEYAEDTEDTEKRVCEIGNGARETRAFCFAEVAGGEQGNG
jgi:hypothetical protein